MSKVAATLQVITDKVLTINDRYLPGDPATLSVENFTTNPTEPVYLDIRGVKNPQSKGRNIRYRVAGAPGWEASFDLFWDASIVGEGQMEAVVHDSGALWV